MFIAVRLKTGSGDNYHFLKEVNSETEMLAEIILAMDTELAHVSDWSVRAIGGNEEKMSNLIFDHIDLLQEMLEDV